MVNILLSRLLFTVVQDQTIQDLAVQEVTRHQKLNLGCEKRLHVAHNGLIPVSFCSISK